MTSKQTPVKATPSKGPLVLHRMLADSSPITAQQISDFDHRRKERRESLTLYQRPIATLRVFLGGAIALVAYAIHWLVSHPIMMYFLFPTLTLWLLLEYIPGPYTHTINQIEFAVEYVVWWVGLGILSSIGLGSGLQSGVLFLFPHIVKVCLAAQSCKTLNFESASDMWFRSPPDLFKCPIDPDPGAEAEVTILGMWQKVVLVCFLQAAGTAIGEIPPYWMSRAASIAASESGSASVTEVPEELESTSRFNFVNRFKTWMIWFLRAYGFWGVLAMASFPNIAFDLCGICCGHFLMPFGTFFAATFIGKALIRNSYQSIVYVILCSEEYLEHLIQLLQYISPDQLHLDQHIREVLEEGRESFKRLSQPAASIGGGLAVPSAASVSTPTASAVSDGGIDTESSSTGKLFYFWWQVFTAVLLAFFFVSCISHFAQYYQLTIDQEDSNKLRQRLPHSVREGLVSPTSGKLNLPPPTAVVNQQQQQLFSKAYSDAQQQRQQQEKQEQLSAGPAYSTDAARSSTIKTTEVKVDDARAGSAAVKASSTKDINSFNNRAESASQKPSSVPATSSTTSRKRE